MRGTFLRRANQSLSQPLTKAPLKEESALADSTSLYEKYKPFATPVEVKGIWRAPRFQGFTKEQFDRCYPPSYKGMRIGLAGPHWFAGKYADPRFDEVSPLVWTFIMFSPLTIWFLVEMKHIYFPSEKKEH